MVENAREWCLLDLQHKHMFSKNTNSRDCGGLVLFVAKAIIARLTQHHNPPQYTRTNSTHPIIPIVSTQIHNTMVRVLLSDPQDAKS